MLCARRLPSQQPPWPRWRATAPTTTALATTATATATATPMAIVPSRARNLSSAPTLRASSDHDGGDHKPAIRDALLGMEAAQREETAKRTLVFRKVESGPEGIAPLRRAQETRRNPPDTTGDEVLVFRKVDPNQAKTAIVLRDPRTQGSPPAGRGSQRRPFRKIDADSRKNALAERAQARAAHRKTQQAGAEQVGMDGTATKRDSSGLLQQASVRRTRLGTQVGKPNDALHAQASAEKDAAVKMPTLSSTEKRDLGPSSRRATASLKQEATVSHDDASLGPVTIPAPNASRSMGGPSLRGGFLVGKSMNPYWWTSAAKQEPGGPRFRVVPAWMKIRAADQGLEPEPSDTQTSGHLSAEKVHQVPHTPDGSKSTKSSGDESVQGQASISTKSSGDESVQEQGSIYERLFERQRPSPEVAPLGSGDEGDGLFHSWDGVDTPMKPRRIDGSIYAQLFPENRQPETEQPEQQEPSEKELEQEAKQTPLAPLTAPEESLFVSLRNEVRNWIPEASRGEVTAPEPGQHGSHSTVVVITAVSSSLVDSDFYRIISEGKYVEGWAGGLVKVVQARDPLSLEPVGEYYLMFHSKPAAVAYTEEVRRLHELSRRLLHAPRSSGRRVARGNLDAAPVQAQPLLTKEEEKAARSFTLCAPDSKPRMSVRMWTAGTVSLLASRSDIADVVQSLQPEVETPSKVLVAVDGHYGGLTFHELWLALRDDGRERGTPWVLKDADEGIMPVKLQPVRDRVTWRMLPRARTIPLHMDAEAAERAGMLATSGAGRRRGSSTPGASTGVHPGEADFEGEEQGEGEEEGESENEKDEDWGAERDESKAKGAKDAEERFNRFVLTFTQPTAARQFVRGWHKRTIWDSQSERSIVIDAVAYM